MSLAQLVTEYGYAAIAIGTFIEGETILILGGLAAHRGYLELPWVLVCAFLGTFAGDQFYFWLGRTRGAVFLARRANFKTRADKVFTLLEQHQVLLILGFRFIYGLRTLTPFLLGASMVSPMRFFVLNLLGGVVWTLTIGLLGYAFGITLEAILGDLKHYETWIFATVLVTGVAAWAWHLRSRNRNPGDQAQGSE